MQCDDCVISIPYFFWAVGNTRGLHWNPVVALASVRFLVASGCGSVVVVVVLVAMVLSTYALVTCDRNTHMVIKSVFESYHHCRSLPPLY